MLLAFAALLDVLGRKSGNTHAPSLAILGSNGGAVAKNSVLVSAGSLKNFVSMRAIALALGQRVGKHVEPSVVERVPG